MFLRQITSEVTQYLITKDLLYCNVSSEIIREKLLSEMKICERQENLHTPRNLIKLMLVKRWEQKNGFIYGMQSELNWNFGKYFLLHIQVVHHYSVVLAGVGGDVGKIMVEIILSWAFWIWILHYSAYKCRGYIPVLLSTAIKQKQVLYKWKIKEFLNTLRTRFMCHHRGLASTKNVLKTILMDKRTDISRNGCNQTSGMYMNMFVWSFVSIWVVLTQHTQSYCKLISGLLNTPEDYSGRRVLNCILPL